MPCPTFIYIGDVNMRDAKNMVIISDEKLLEHKHKDIVIYLKEDYQQKTAECIVCDRTVILGREFDKPIYRTNGGIRSCRGEASRIAKLFIFAGTSVHVNTSEVLQHEQE